jgi:hypothetical protein
VPHSPHSNVKIIMPMPLASTLHPHMNIHSARRHASINGQGYDPLSRLSVVDKWASSVRSPDSSDQGSRSHSLGMLYCTW